MINAQVPAYGEPDDSGIDSDQGSRLAGRGEERATDASSSEEDDRPFWDERVVMSENEFWKAMERPEPDQGYAPLQQWPVTTEESAANDISSSDRASPPLYEVELTASDEDDDASVLELVIPMQNSRYQRVPTTTTKKVKPKSPRILSHLFCCMRK